MNYPVKYAILTLKSDDINNDTKYYVVSKCYVLENSIRYFEEGKKRVLYKVVFPYPKLTGDFSVKTEPSFNNNGDPYLYELVNRLYDDYKEAKEDANIKNNNMNLKLLSEVSLERNNWEEEVDRVQKEYDDKLNMYYEFENKLQEATSNMDITDEILENDLKLIRK